MFSSEINWKTNQEIYHIHGKIFDIDAAKRIIIANPRDIDFVETKELEELVQYNGENTKSFSKVDLSIPIILASLDGIFWPIDGWHRIEKAIRIGIDLVPAVLLSQRETRKIRISSILPGQYRFAA